MVKSESCQHEDWVSNSRSYMLAWGLPGIILIVGVFVDPLMRTMLWVGALIWKGAACLVNATRCGRTHCYFTGPFFLLLAIGTILHGFQIVPLGANGWIWLGITIVVGGGGLWFLTERRWGKYSPKLIKSNNTSLKIGDTKPE